MSDKKVSYGAKPWVSYFSISLGALGLLLAIVRYPMYPFMFAGFALIFSYLVLTESEAAAQLKLLARVGAGLGALTLIIAVVLLFV